jgi:hypothetical protein
VLKHDLTEGWGQKLGLWSVVDPIKSWNIQVLEAVILWKYYI